MQNEGGLRPRPRSFIGGGSNEFTYDRHSGGIRDAGETKENVERKPRRPLSLYETLSKDLHTSRQNSTSPTRPDDGKPFAQLNREENVDNMNKEKLKRIASNEKGDGGLGSRKMSDSSDARALYVELSSPPTKSGSVDEKFNAVSRLRSLFDQGKSAPVTSRKSTGFIKDSNQTQARSTIDHDTHNRVILGQGTKEIKSELATRKPKFEKVEAEKKRKLFAPPASIKLDDLLKRDSPRSPEEKQLPKFRRSFPIESGKHENALATDKKQPRVSDSEVFAQKQIVASHAPPELDEFEEVHKRRRSLPKKRASSFEFEGLEDYVEVFGKKSIDINSILGIEPPKEDPIAETREGVVDVNENALNGTERKEEDGASSNEEKVGIREEMLNADTKADEKLVTSDESNLFEASASEDRELKDEQDLELEQKDVEDRVEFRNDEAVNLIASVEDFQEARIDEISSKEEVYLPSDECLTEVDNSMKKEERDSIDEEAIMPQVEEIAESGLDFNALDNLEIVSEHNDSVIMECDSFDSFALNVKSSNGEIDEEVTDHEPRSLDAGGHEDETVAAIMEVDEIDRASERREHTFDVDDKQAKLETEFSCDLKSEEDLVEDAALSLDAHLNVDKEIMEEDATDVALEVNTQEECETEIEDVAKQDIGDEECKVLEEEALESGYIPVSQMSIIATVSGLTEEEEKTGETLDDSADETVDSSMHETVELDDEYYDSDNILDDDSVNYDNQLLYSSINDAAEEFKGVDESDDHEDDYTDDGDHFDEDKATYENLHKQDEDTSVNESDHTVILPPAPSHSCLASRNSSVKKERNVSFHEKKGDVIFTYSAEEYNRSNYEIDAFTASVEWELEKRVEEKDMFTVDLDKRDGGLGLSIIGLGVGTDSGVEKLGIFVKSLTPNGASYKDRRIQVQDQILEVNGISLVGVTQDFAANTLRNTSGKVRFLMGRDKSKRHYQAPTSTSDPILQELERKHNLELEEINLKTRKVMNTSLQQAESRASIAEHNLDEIRQSLLEEEERCHKFEDELENARNEIEHMKESPFYQRKSLKNEIKKPKYEKKNTEKIENLEKSLSKLTNQLSFSEENLDKIQHENDERIEELKEMLKEKEGELVHVQNENNELLLTRKQNAEKLSELEECLGAANHDQERRIKEVQELKDKCVDLEMEVKQLREENLQLEAFEKLQVAEKVVHIEDEKVHADAKEEFKVSKDEIEKLKGENEHLSEEVALRNQFADIIVAERDSLKALVASLENANDKQIEAQEKRDIENAVKMMAYENKIKDLENLIKDLQGQQQEKPKQKLFPEIEAKVEVEKEIQVQSEIVVENEQTRELEIKSPFSLPPRDYDDSYSLESTGGSHVVVEGKEVLIARDRKDSSSSSSNSENEEQGGKHYEKTEIIEEPVPNDEVKIVDPGKEKEPNQEEEPKTVLEATVEVLEVTPVSVAVEESNPNIDVICAEVSGDEKTVLNDVVNPVQKPPRTYSDVSHVRQDKHLRSYSVNGRLQEDVIVENEKKATFVKVSDNIQVKGSSKYQVIVKSGIVEEYSQNPLDEEILKDLPESSVDSDSEILAEMKPQTDALEAITPGPTETALDTARTEPALKQDLTSEHAPDGVTPDGGAPDGGAPDGGAPDEGALDGDTINRVVQQGDAPNPEALPPTNVNGEEAVGDTAAQDRSSFLEAFSQNPSFGSWFNGELTIIEQERKDEQAEEIASKVVEGKKRALSSSSSSASSVDEVKNELNTSLKLDESYLQRSQVQFDETDSALNRLESVAIESPLEEQAKIDELVITADSRRPLSTNFDDLPTTAVLPNAAQRDKLKLASAIPRKSPKSKVKSTSDMNVKPETANRGDNQGQASSMQNTASASTEHLALEIDYMKRAADKEKRRSHFNFFQGMFGKKKKHKKSTENLLAAGEPSSVPVEEVPGDVGKEAVKETSEEEEGVVPLEMQGNDVDVRMSADSGVDTQHPINGLSSDGSDSIPSSTLASPVISRGIEDSNENIPSADVADGSSNSSKDDRLSWIQKPVAEWDVRQVGLWLIRMGLEEYSDSFQKNKIDGHELLHLNGSRLKDIGVISSEDRATIKKRIKEFKANSDGKSKDTKKDGKTRDKFSKKLFWKGKYTVND